MPNPIVAPACAASEFDDGIDEVVMMADPNKRTANPSPRNDGISKIPPITRTTWLNFGTFEAVIEPAVLQALQSNINYIVKNSLFTIFYFERLQRTGSIYIDIQI